ENIGIGAVFRAPMPNRIYCPHCKARLQHTPITGLVAAAVVLGVALSLSAVYVVSRLWEEAGPLAALAAGGGVLIAGGAVLEVVFVLILWYGDYRLVTVGRPADDEDEF